MNQKFLRTIVGLTQSDMILKLLKLADKRLEPSVIESIKENFIVAFENCVDGDLMKHLLNLKSEETLQVQVFIRSDKNE